MTRTVLPYALTTERDGINLITPMNLSDIWGVVDRRVCLSGEVSLSARYATRRPSVQLPSVAFVNFLQNHDQTIVLGNV